MISCLYFFLFVFFLFQAYNNDHFYSAMASNAVSKSHFLHPTSNGRQDVLALKQHLADALGENGPLYWDALRDFVMGKLNRQEFDFYANLYLSRQNGKKK